MAALGSLLWLTFSGLAQAAVDDVTIDAPKILLTDVEFDVSIDGLTSNAELRVNGENVQRLSPDAATAVGVQVGSSGINSIEVVQNGAVIAAHEVSSIPGWLSILPPLVAILLAFALRSVIPALFVGMLVGAWAINGLTWEGAFVGFFETVTIYIVQTSIKPDHMQILIFTFLIGGMVGIVSRNGGMLGIVNRIMPIASTPKRGQSVVATLGMVIFFDDYANTMIVGNAARPVSDKLRISREKLAYLVDSTAAPVATIAIITTWIGFQLGLISSAIESIDGITESAYMLFLNSIPYSFYPFLAIFFVWLIVLSGKDFGPMYHAEMRARSSTDDLGPTTAPVTDMAGEFSEKEGIPCRAMNAIVPILTLVFSVIGGLFVSGDGDSVREIVGSADSYIILLWASLLSCFVAIVMTMSQRLLTLNEIVDSWLVGARFMLTGLVLLIMAWAIADVAEILQTAPYLISILGDQISPQLLPGIVFLLAASTAFASGSSWGVMAILMPLVIPLCWAVLLANGMATPEHMHILYSCIACVLTGAVWADHCSPISDTTVLSSLATGCDHMEHVRTQLPYAALGGAVAFAIGVVPAGYGQPWWILLPAGAGALYVVHRFLGKTVPESVTE